MAIGMLLIGFLLGMIAMGVVWASGDKNAIRRGFIQLDDHIYKLTLISTRDLKGDIDE